MPNHFHLVVETPQPDLVVGVKWFLGTYTSRFNRRHRASSAFLPVGPNDSFSRKNGAPGWRAERFSDELP
jgi:REP element-mobilizing transposase RayT